MARVPFRLTGPALVLLLVALVGIAAAIGLSIQQAAAPPDEPAPVARLLSADQLRMAIEEVRGTGTTLDVLADVTIDPTRLPAPRSRECVPVGRCTVVGVLQGFDDALGVVVVRDESLSHVLPPAAGPAELQAPVALRLGPGPIEFLGHAELRGQRTVWTVAEAGAARTSTRAGVVVAVDGWLAGIGPATCGPYPGPGVPAPFDCATHDSLNSQPHRANGLPQDLIVQRWAYREWAPDQPPGNDETQPRRAIYLLRMVVADVPGRCSPCGGWLVVGRLDAAPRPGPRPGTLTVRSGEELQLLLAEDRPGWVGRIVVVHGEVLPGTCIDPRPCTLGTLLGSEDSVTASEFTASQLTGRDGPGLGPYLTLRVRTDDLEYLGRFGGWADEPFAPTPIDRLTDPLILNNAPLVVTAVEAWLVHVAISCPTVIPHASDTPFSGCPLDWLTPKEEARPYAPGAIVVQEGAYQAFALDPAPGPDPAATAPRFGTYLLRLIQNPAAAGDVTGWQVIARIAP